MIALKTLVAHLNDLFQIDTLKDYCPNGLQVEGKPNIRRIMTGVTACQALLDRAVEEQADALLVHHGYFWRGQSAQVVGVHAKRLRTLLQHDISLIAYHLPLDLHKTLGNNVQLARVLEIDWQGEYFPLPDGLLLGFKAALALPDSGESLKNKIHQALGRTPLHIPGQSKRIKRIGWCTGAAGDFVEQAAQAGLEAYLTGEISERTVHLARETGIHLFAAGHHATERYGIQALGAYLASQFGLEHVFVDIDNPV